MQLTHSQKKQKAQEHQDSQRTAQKPVTDEANNKDCLIKKGARQSLGVFVGR